MASPFDTRAVYACPGPASGSWAAPALQRSDFQTIFTAHYILFTSSHVQKKSIIRSYKLIKLR